MVNKEIYNLLDKEGLEYLAKAVLKKVNARIDERIVTIISSASDDQHVPSALAVYRAISDSQHLKIKTWVGDIDDIPMEERSSNVLYYQKDSEEDPTWSLYIWDEDNTKWVCLGNTDVVLEDYWRKDEIDELKAAAGIDNLDDEVAEINGKIANIDDEIVGIKGNIDDINEELDKKVNKEDIVIIPDPVIKDVLDRAYEATDPFKYEDVDTAEAITDAIAAAVEAGSGEVAVRVTSDLDFRGVEPTVIEVPDGVELTVNLDESEIVCENNAFSVKAGGTLKLIGDGTLTVKTTAAKAAINAENGSTVIIDGITIDGTTQGTDNNWVYGVYAKNQSRVEFKSGVIKVAGASCISTNNTTGGSDIIVTGGELYSEGGYAIYCPAQGTVDISNAIVQGVHARMGTINIGAGAQIIPPAIDASNAADLGSNINTSGSIELGDAIVLIAGSYADANGVDINLTISDDATVESNFRSAIGVYLFDTKAGADAQVVINVENPANVRTNDADFDAIKVYDHDAIAEAATAAGKTYSPKATSTVTINA